jgi:hypothetical protein
MDLMGQDTFKGKQSCRLGDLSAILSEARSAAADLSSLVSWNGAGSYGLFGSVAILTYAQTNIGSDELPYRPIEDVDIAIPHERIPILLKQLTGKENRFRCVTSDPIRQAQGRVAVFDNQTKLTLDVFSNPLRLNKDIDVSKSLSTGTGLLELGELLVTALQYAQLEASYMYDATILFSALRNMDNAVQKQQGDLFAELGCSGWSINRRLRKNLQILINSAKHRIAELGVLVGWERQAEACMKRLDICGKRGSWAILDKSHHLFGFPRWDESFDEPRGLWADYNLKTAA